MHDGFRRHFLVELGIIFKLVDDRAHQRSGFCTLGNLLFEQFDIGQYKTFAFLFERQMPGALLAFDEHANRAIGQFEQLQDRRNHAEIIKLIAGRIIFRRIELSDEKNFLVRIHRLLERHHGFVAADKQRYDHIREHHNIAQWQ